MSYRSASDRYGLTKLYPPIQFVDNGKQVVFESEHMVSEGSLDEDRPYHCFPRGFIDSNNVIHIAWSKLVTHGAPGGLGMYQRVYHNGTSWVIEAARWVSPELASPGDTHVYGIQKMFETSDGAICAVVSQTQPDGTLLFFGTKSFNGGDSFEPVDPENSLVTDYYYTLSGPCGAIKQNGYWIIPVYGEKNDGDARQGGAFATPENDGLHWTRLGQIAPPIPAIDYEENGLIQRADKLIIGASRTDDLGRIDFSLSVNGSRTFSTPITKNVPSTAKPDFMTTPSGTIFGYGRYNHPAETPGESWRTMRIISTDGGGTFSWDWADSRVPDEGVDANAQQYAFGVWHPVLERIIIIYGCSHGTTPFNGNCDLLMHVLREEDV